MGQTGDLQVFYGAKCCVGFGSASGGGARCWGSERGSGGWEWSEHERERQKQRLGEELQREGRDAKGDGCHCMMFECPSLFPHEGSSRCLLLVGAFGVNVGGGVCGRSWA